MSAPERASAALYAVDIDRVVAFYTGAAGMGVAHAEAGFTTLTSSVLELNVVGIRGDVADTIEIADPPVRREETPIKLAFVVSSIEVARAAAPSLGGGVDGPEREWEFNGWRVCDGHDPEGNVVQFRESLV